MLKTAKRDLENNDLKACANRSYYAIFHAMRAVMALEGVDFRKHSGVILHFHKEYIKTNKFSVEFADIINMAFLVRNKSDYDDFYIILKSDVEKQLESAEKFANAVNAFIDSN